ncbi:MAG: DUF2267 domain-containing protein [Methylocystis sp.]|uniref:DUF2267 domain-containing protein n=1 Tax=Methylocystis sp. TaxID=1911079 RepID=UPI003DA4C84D
MDLRAGATPRVAQPSESFWKAATLHALRDSLPAHEAVFLGDHLTLLLRGLYYEGWRMSKYSALKTREAFLERVREGVHRDPGIDAEHVARTVLALLAQRVPAAELEDFARCDAELLASVGAVLLGWNGHRARKRPHRSTGRRIPL